MTTSTRPRAWPTLLRLSGHEVRVAYGGPAALEAARAFRPQVVLLDLGLPGLDGYEVARRLRADPLTADCLLVAVSGYGQAEDRARSKEAGFDHHLTKPPDLAGIAPPAGRAAAPEWGAQAFPERGIEGRSAASGACLDVHWGLRTFKQTPANALPPTL